ncbi:hypothetical protein NQ315_016567 [Exocentrus adspersus]|uniref:Ubinuclein-1 n=1 Tax=Exocentrus adspersus TaxID=1586481 RepID=A0AAV8VZP8_9CUCU|nr:hypothetical protein NQ315_016567 [Exocentrus adspersus]
MSEIKRVALNTFEPQKVSDKVNKKPCKTVRISVILPESNEDKCPEYNYKDQLAAVKNHPEQFNQNPLAASAVNRSDFLGIVDVTCNKVFGVFVVKYLQIYFNYEVSIHVAMFNVDFTKKNIHFRPGRWENLDHPTRKCLKQGKEPNNQENGLDPFPDDDDDVRRIALEMEAKYGSGMTKKKRKGRKDDYADIGMGYDESDSFIDNTDGYDEIIPQNVTTLHGGFYINCGALEFKTDEEASSDISSSESDDEAPPSTSRKRVLDTSEESDSDTANTSHQEKKPKLQSTKNSMQQAIKKKLFSQNKIQVKKRRPIDPLKKTVKELLREKRQDLNMSLPMELQDENEDNIGKDSLKENKKPMSISSVTDAIESVVKQQIGEVDYNSPNQNLPSGLDVNKKSDPVHKNGDIPSSVEGESSQEANKIEKTEIKLPESLPADILSLINKIKQAALEYKGEGKKRFFSDEVNFLLLHLERKCKILGKSSRVRIYDHLALYTKVRKETLSRRAKNLVLEEEEKKLNILTVKLKENIDQIMPSLTINFEQESQRILQKKFSKESADSEENKALKMPRRRFKWTDESKKLLKDILGTKRKCLILEGKQKDNLDEQITQYLRTLILPLWPEGWMYLNSLKKVYDNMIENSKSLDSTSSPNSSYHSSITVTPVSNTKPPKVDVTLNDVTFSKTGINEMKSGMQTDAHPSVTFSKTGINEMKSGMQTDAHPSTHLNSFDINSIISVKPSEPSNSNTVQSNSTSKEAEKSKHEKEYDHKVKPQYTSALHSIVTEKSKYDKEHDYRTSKQLQHTTSNTVKETERSKYEKVHEYKSSKHPQHISTTHSSNTVKDTERARYEKEHEYKKLNKHSQNTHQSSTTAKETERSRHDKEHEYRASKLSHHTSTVQSSNIMRDTERTRYDKEHAYESGKQPSATQSSSSTKDVEKTVRYDKEYDYKKLKISQNTNPVHSSSTAKETERSRYDAKHDYKKAVVVSSEPYKSSRNVLEETSKTHSDSSVIILNARKEDVGNSIKENNKGLNAVIPKTTHCQLIDLTDKSETKYKSKSEEVKPYKYVKEASRSDLMTSSSLNQLFNEVKKISSKHPELNVTPNLTSTPPQKVPSKSDGDDIQMVMENLKALQKLSSPVKADNPTSSPVSVIAYNRSFSPKSNSNQSSSGQKSEVSKADFNNSFQEEFQKQFINSLQNMSATSNSSKSSYNRCS